MQTVESSAREFLGKDKSTTLVASAVSTSSKYVMSFSISIRMEKKLKGGPGASGRVLPPVTRRSRVRVAVSSHCTSEGKA